MLCPKCREPNNDDATECANCGAPLHPAPQAPKTCDGAIWALILSIMGLLFTPFFCLGLLLGPFSMLLGFLSILEIRRSRGRLKGKALARAAIIIGLCAIPALPVYWVGSIELSNYLEIRRHRQKFDAQVWRSDAKHYSGLWSARSCMVDDLISSKKLKGLTRDQVIQILGTPFGNGYPAGAKSCDINYRVGICRGGMHMDDEWLFLTLGPDGKVNRYWLYVD